MKKWYNKRADVLDQPSYCYKQFKNPCNLIAQSLQRNLAHPKGYSLLFHKSQRISHEPSLSIQTMRFWQWAQRVFNGDAILSHLLSFQSAIRAIEQSILYFNYTTAQCYRTNWGYLVSFLGLAKVKKWAFSKMKLFPYSLGLNFGGLTSFAMRRIYYPII